MLSLTREQFKQRFGKSPGTLFDLDKILTSQHRIEAMQFPSATHMRVRREYGTIKGSETLKDLIYGIDVGYYIKDGNFKAVITHVFIFDTQLEQDVHKIEIEMQTVPIWNQN